MKTETDLLEDEESTAFRTRLGQAIGVLGGLRSASLKAGVTEDSLANWRDGRAQPKFRNVVALARAAQVSLDWLAFGQGSFQPGADASAPAHGPDKSGHHAAIPRTRLAFLGPSLDSSQTLASLGLESEWIRRTLQSDPAALELFTAVGENMEPTIRAGDIVVFDTSVNQIIDNSLYVIELESIAVIRRVQRKLDDTIILKSDNKAYDDEICDPGRVKVAGLVRWIGRVS